MHHLKNLLPVTSMSKEKLPCISAHTATEHSEKSSSRTSTSSTSTHLSTSTLRSLISDGLEVFSNLRVPRSSQVWKVEEDSDRAPTRRRWFSERRPRTKELQRESTGSNLIRAWPTRSMSGSKLVSLEIWILPSPVSRIQNFLLPEVPETNLLFSSEIFEISNTKKLIWCSTRHHFKVSKPTDPQKY